MKKWLVVLLLLSLWTGTVQAATSINVTVTATGWICGACDGLTFTYISDTQIDISWTKGAGANNTMIRAAYGRYPSSMTDGYLVYQGTGVSTSDTGVNLEETIQDIYYRGWSQNAGGVWAPLTCEAVFEEVALIQSTLLVLCFALTVVLFIKRWRLFGIIVALMWFLNALYQWDKASGTDWHWGLMMLSWVLSFSCLFSPWFLREKQSETEELSEEEEYRREQKAEWQRYKRRKIE